MAATLRKQVVITGLGVVSAIGLGKEDFWSALLNQTSGIRSLAQRTDGGAKPAANSKPAGLWIGAPIVDFDPKQYVRPRKALKVMCREIQTAFTAAQMAVEDAGLSGMLPASEDGPVRPQRIGTVFGGEMYYGSSDELTDAFNACRRDDGSVDESQFGNAAIRGVMPLWMLKYLPNMPACHVGISLNAHGPNNTLVLGDVSGPAALMEAAHCIRRGLADIMMSGAAGTRISTTRLNYSGDLPTPGVREPIGESSRPHDPTATGVVGGEAAVSFVLESVESAESRQTKVLATLEHFASRFVPAEAMRQDERSAKLDAASRRGSAQAIRCAIEAVLRDAELDASAVGLVVSHGMGDPQNDGAELQAITETLPSTPLVAPIASLGHTGAASGALELATAVLAIATGTIPPTLNANSADPAAHLQSSSTPLNGQRVLAITHTSEGNATAILLS